MEFEVAADAYELQLDRLNSYIQVLKPRDVSVPGHPHLLDRSNDRPAYIGRMVCRRQRLSSTQ